MVSILGSNSRVIDILGRLEGDVMITLSSASLVRESRRSRVSNMSAIAIRLISTTFFASKYLAFSMPDSAFAKRASICN